MELKKSKTENAFLDLWGQLAVMVVITSPEVISPEPQKKRRVLVL